MDQSSNERIKKIASFVHDHLYEVASQGKDKSFYSSADYRWKHTLRVCQHGLAIARAEGANTELTVAGCLLHDIAAMDAMQDDRDHGRVGARMARPFLKQIGYPDQDVENICFSVAVHVDDKADFDHPVTLEAKIVSDADNIDRFGAYRILLRCQPDLDDFDSLVAGAEERLKTLRRYREQQIMGTKTGNDLFNRQLDFQIEFFQRLIEQRNQSFLPEV